MRGRNDTQASQYRQGEDEGRKEVEREHFSLQRVLLSQVTSSRPAPFLTQRKGSQHRDFPYLVLPEAPSTPAAPFRAPNRQRQPPLRVIGQQRRSSRWPGLHPHPPLPSWRASVHPSVLHYLFDVPSPTVLLLACSLAAPVIGCDPAVILVDRVEHPTAARRAAAVQARALAVIGRCFSPWRRACWVSLHGAVGTGTRASPVVRSRVAHMPLSRPVSRVDPGAHGFTVPAAASGRPRRLRRLARKVTGDQAAPSSV